MIDEGKETNGTWEEAWRVATDRNEEGLSIELEIPFNILRMRKSDAEIGLEFQRIIRRKNEFVYWNSWERDFRFEEVSRARASGGIAKSRDGQAVAFEGLCGRRRRGEGVTGLGQPVGRWY